MISHASENHNKSYCLEIEVKFLANDISSIRERLLSMGACSEGQLFEVNHRYDDSNSTLFKAKKLLRLRKTDRNTLTLKKPPAVPNPDYKIHEETEIEVSDFDLMEKILIETGFLVVQSYEKYRETFVSGDTKILIDIMPFGSFIEIEGAEESIKSHSENLGLDWNNKITLNYLEIFANISKRLNLGFTNITFENFEPIKASFAIEPSDIGLSFT